MSGFRSHRGRLAVYDADHVDTDRIIPARFLSMVTRAGYGELLFKDVRSPEFALNQPEAQGASILVAGTNFGCGSSREHAVWALQQAGFQAVVARVEAASPGFSDIFRQNAANCGLLLVELDAASHARLVEAGSGAEAEIDLEDQTVRWDRHEARFEIAPGLKRQIMLGQDLVGTTLELSDAIATFERDRLRFAPVPQPSAL